MNPSSAAKIRALGARLRLGPHSTVLDLGCGTGGPAVLLAKEYGCRVTGVDHHEPFLAHARERAEEAGVVDLVDLVASDGAEFVGTAPSFDAALCIGAAWILGGFASTATTLREHVPLGGHVVIGDSTAGTKQ
ncbi:MAG TPA: methyltransferase domain-containing protein [Acidimicrobiales bacterium]|nr:methyltransferase domain-containing protein [Acidimicrobiales bacterium]